MLETRVTGGSRYLSHSGQDRTPYWICRDCANYRRRTFRILCWLVGVPFALGLIRLVMLAFR